MECQQLHRYELAEKYLHGRLDSAAQDEFEVHILECIHCLRQVEAVQTLRQELSERSPQIRAHTQVERFQFRWQWVSVAAFGVMVCVLGIVEFRGMKAPQSARLQEKPSAPATSAVGSSGAVPGANSSQAAATATIDHAPVSGRNYINFTLNDSRVSRDNAPSTGSSLHAGSNISGQRSRSNLVSVERAEPTDNSVKGIRTTELAPPAAGSSLAPALEKSVIPIVASSDEAAKVLFRLGTVQPPPYTFSGFASSSGRDAAMDPGALSSKSAKSTTNQPRPFFRDAMDAYVDRRYADASDLLEQAARAEPNAPDVNFYLGVCRLLQAKPADSLAPLQSVLVDEKSPWAQSAHFYLAKAYIQTGDLARAEAELQAAAKMAGRLEAEAASELTRLQAIRASEEGQNNSDVSKP